MFPAGFSKTPGLLSSDDGQSNLDSTKDVINIESKIDDYLERQGTVLWGEYFEIESTKGRRRAKEFILDLLIDLELTNESVE